MTEELRKALDGMLKDSDNSPQARAYYHAAILALDAYDASSKISALAEARANMKMLASRIVVADAVDNELQELLTR